MLSAALSNPRISAVVDSCLNGASSIFISHPSAQAFLAYLIAEKLDGTIGFVVDDNHPGGEPLFRDLRSFFDENISEFPLFLDGRGAVPGFISKKRRDFEQSYAALMAKASHVGLAFESALSYPVGGGKGRQKDCLTITVGDPKARDVIVERLSLWGYQNTDRCISPNTYAVRGGIVDLYPTSMRAPIRVEFFTNKVESIRYFNEETQLSISNLKEVVVFPPVDPLGGQKTLSEIYHNHYTKILYITGSSLSLSSGGPLPGASLYVESLGAPALMKKDLVGLVESWGSTHESVYFFNPAKQTYLFSSSVRVVERPISAGFRIDDLGFLCVGAPKTASKPPPLKSYPDGIPVERLEGLNEINWGDYLVHIDFGIGVYRGLSLVGKRGSDEENIKIEYKAGAVVHVPVNRFGRVHKYIGTGGGPPPVSRLGSGLWEKQKQTTKKSTASVVESLIRAYKLRVEPRGFSYTNDLDLMGRLERSFPYQETGDQLLAIQDINNDMDKPNPMDRLLYGDVGFGKTEVAVRAAMRAVISDRVVFFLAPTTVLSDQHYITCKNRLGPLGVSVELLSRFKTKKEQRDILERLHRGGVDVLVGTHRILKEDVPTINLGLLIVDEEQRFGVKHKETIRRLKTRVDILTLTATPIPRTLQQSLIGMRDTSKIVTPPGERLPIETTVSYFDWDEIKSAIRLETGRGGQVYFLHNNVRSLPYYFDKIRGSFPNLRVSIAHGQMNSRELEKTVLAFFGGTIDVLLCSTIIESGLDVQNANTIIINDAQNLGLAQLYQIRGRVGRGKRQAFCFLCIPKKTRLLPDAYQRLRAIEHYSALGSGFGVAMRDLEIRGAGNLFGYEQSGEVSKVGLELYNKILSSALDKKRGVTEDNQKEHLSVVFPGDAYLGRDYMPLVQDRLAFYQKISRATSGGELLEIKEETRDRFGRFTKKEENLFLISEVKCRLYPFPFTKCVFGSGRVVFTLSSLPADCEGSVFLQNMDRVFRSQPTPYRVSMPKKEFLELSFLTKNISEALLFARKFDRLFSRVLSK